MFIWFKLATGRKLWGHKLVWGTGAPVIGCLVITVFGSGRDLWEELTELLDGGGGAEGRGAEAWGGGGEEVRGAGEASVVEAEGPAAKVDWEDAGGAPGAGSSLIPVPDRPMAANFFFTPWLSWNHNEKQIDEVDGDRDKLFGV